MVAFGPVPTAPAHAKNPLIPKLDRSTEAQRGPAMPVPRAPRAAAKAQSAGALARASWSRRPSSDSCLHRRDCHDGDGKHIFEHRRISSLTREVDAVDNQCFEMGPKKSVDGRKDFKRGHLLGVECKGAVGMPWKPPSGIADAETVDELVSRARKNTLLNEKHAAEQGLEWVPNGLSGIPAFNIDSDHSRVSTLAREDKEAFEFLPGAGRNAYNPPSDGRHGRKNLLVRESQKADSVQMPQASNHDASGVPQFGRKAHFAKEINLGAALRGVGASVLAH